EAPEEYSLGTSPTKAPMVLPVNRLQSPISTANASPVRSLMPRRQPRRRTNGVNSESAAIAAVAAGLDGQHRVEVGLEGSSAKPMSRTVGDIATPHERLSTPARRSRRSPVAARASRAGAGPASDPPDSPPGRERDRVRALGRRSGSTPSCTRQAAATEPDTPRPWRRS